MTIYGARETPDGEWRVEVVRREGQQGFWYRVIHGENVIDWLSIGGVDRLLSEAGVGLGELVEAAPGTDEGEERQANGA